MRVLYLITELDPGGAERNLYRLLRELKYSLEALVVSLRPGGEVAEWLRKEGIEVNSLSVESALSLWRASKLRSIIRSFKPDLIHSFLHHANLLARLMASSHTPVLSSVRVAERERKWHILTEKLTFFLSTAIVCVSKGVRRHLIRSCGVPPSKLFVIPNSVDVETIDKTEQLPRGSLGSEGYLVTYTGRLTRQKGVRYLLDAFRLVLSVVDARLLIVGRGEEEGSLRSLATQYAISGKTSFLGYRADAVGIMKASDILVLPSLWEGMPNVVLEAMAGGVPVVATNVEGTSELITDGETGLLVEPRNPSQLAEAILRVLRDEELRCRLAHSARQRVRDYSPEKIARAYKELYKRIGGDLES